MIEGESKLCVRSLLWAVAGHQIRIQSLSATLLLVACFGLRSSRRLLISHRLSEAGCFGLRSSRRLLSSLDRHNS